MPLADSVMLSTVRRLRGTIFAPEESSSSWTFFSIPFTSKSRKGMTLSLLFTDKPKSAQKRYGAEAAEGMRTVESPHNRLLVVPRLDHNLDVRVLAREVLEVLDKIRARVRGCGPLLAVFEHHFADVRQESGMSVRWPGP